MLMDENTTTKKKNFATKLSQDIQCDNSNTMLGTPKVQRANGVESTSTRKASFQKYYYRGVDANCTIQSPNSPEHTCSSRRYG